jgi:hypothetical protein
MGSLSNYCENKILDHALKNTAWSASPTAVYLSLHTADPTETGGVGEVSGTNYVRKAITFAAPASRQILQSGDVNFDQAGAGGWGTVTHYGVWDASASGNSLAYGSLTSSLLINQNDTPTVASGEVDISFSAGDVSNYLAHELLDHIFRDAEYTVPTNIYVILCTVAITDASTGATVTECDMTSYAPELCNGWDAAASGATANTAEITYGALTGSSDTIEAFALTDNATTASANIMFYDNGISQAISSGNTARFIAGALDITLT